MPKVHPLPRLATALLTTLLVAVPTLAESEIGSSASFPKACSAIASLSDVPAAAQRVTAGNSQTDVISYRQVSSTNQALPRPAFLLRTKAAGELWCRR